MRFSVEGRVDFPKMYLIDLFSGIINVGNGISYGIWPLEGGEQNRGRRPHLLYVTRWSREAVCGSNVPKSDHSLSKVFCFFSSLFICGFLS